MAEAREAIVQAASFRTDDSAYQLQASRALFYIDQAISKLALVDRTLTYAEPVLPVLQFDEGFEAFGQYGYDVADLLIAAWTDGALFPDYKAYAAVLSQFWLVQNTGTDAGFRASGAIAGTKENSLDGILGGGTSGVNQRLHNMLVNLGKLDGTRAGRPVFDANWLRIISAKYSDCWRHTDRAAREIAR
jgi:hypothetical protein